MDAITYTIGVVSGEMSASYEVEALKAQAVAAYTFACYRRSLRAGEDYDVTDSYTTDQAFLSEEAQRKKWGDNYEANLKKIREAVESVAGQMLTYEGEPILAVVHSISGGNTESAENVWGKEYPCLKPVESAGDVLSPGYLSTVTVSAEDFKKAVEELEVKVSGEPDTWLGKSELSESGTVLSIKICGTKVKGTQLRSKLSLRSANFDIKFNDGNFEFSVRGYGHGVGMSQHGAKNMAEQGYNAYQILDYFYKNFKFAKLSDNWDL